jgi:hypothetical protein
MLPGSFRVQLFTPNSLVPTLMLVWDIYVGTGVYIR